MMKIDGCFVLSMMTVLDEPKSIRKYDYLYFVEFLEFLCRIAIVGLAIVDTVEYKVYFFLEILFEKFYQDNLMSRKDYPLKEVDEKYAHERDA